MFNKAIIVALLVGGLGISVAGCEEFYKDRNLVASSEPKKAPVIAKAETVKPETVAVRPKTATARPRATAVRPRAEVAQPARAPFAAAGDTSGEQEIIGDALNISTFGKYFVSGSPLIVRITSGKLSSAFYSQSLAMRPYHPRHSYLWATGTGRLVYDANLKTLTQTVNIGKDSPAKDEYQKGDVIQVALLEVPRKNTEPIKFISTKRMVYYEDRSGPQALLVSDQIDNLGDRITIILPANAARAFPGIETAVLRIELEDRPAGIKLKVNRETMPKKFPANRRVKYTFTIIPASELDQKKWEKAHTIPRKMNIRLVGRHGQRMPKIDRQLTIRGTTY